MFHFTVLCGGHGGVIEDCITNPNPNLFKTPWPPNSTIKWDRELKLILTFRHFVFIMFPTNSNK